MNLLKDRRGFVDMEVIMSPGFIILTAMAITATLLGWKFSMGMVEDGAGWPLWQIIFIMVAEVAACYIITWRMSG